MNELQLTKLGFTLELTQRAYLPQFIGNTIRGALGRALDDNSREVYDAVFKVVEGESVPNPFVISAPYPCKDKYRAGKIVKYRAGESVEYKAGERLEFFITLFGSACAYDKDIVDAASLMCRGKLAGAVLFDVRCEYSRTWSDSNADTIPFCDALMIEFITPTELLSSKQPVYEPDFSAFIDSLLGRISAIIDNYGENEFIIPYSLIARKPKVSAKYELEQILIHSNSHPISGFIGGIDYFGDVTRYLPYIDLGSQLHLGKKTTRSCGEYVFSI